ncbi:Hexitol phosphatase B [Thermoflexales bacterium]|nr:Hexitol phosphatase B [Thermoflexales bacterium]
MNLPSRIRAVIFDMDGVLTDSEPLINTAAIAMFKEKGLVVSPEDFLPFVGAGEDRYIGGVAEKYHFPLDLLGAKQRTYEIYLGLVPASLQAFPGARAFVQACREAGLLLAVASSADAVKITANLRKIDLPLDLWDAVVPGEEVQNKKPAPDIFLSAAKKLAVDPVECVVIEDAVNGVLAAKAAGMRCLAVAQTFPAEQLQAADVVRENIRQVRLSDLDPALVHQFDLPENLPIPIDDGACQHLTGLALPSSELMSTAGRWINLAQLPGRVVVYCYPRTGRPGVDPPSGWDEIPGARGCTPQACAFRDHYAELQRLDTQVFGLSTQDTDYQREAVARLHLPFELLSDASLEFAGHLRLPTFEVDGVTLIKRLTLIINAGRIEQVFYPVFPPDKNAEEVIDWLRAAR